MSDSKAPPPDSGGGLKYAIIGAGLLLAALAIFFGMRSCEDPPPDPVADAGPADTGPATAPIDDDLYIPELEPDTGPEPDTAPRVRYVTRYVGGGGGSFNCSGSLNQSAAASTMAQNQLQFRNCYERRLKVNNDLEGRVNLQLRVGRDGSVTGVRTGGSMRDAQVLSCIRNIAQRIHFPQVQGGSCAVVQAPLNFTPRR